MRSVEIADHNLGADMLALDPALDELFGIDTWEAAERVGAYWSMTQHAIAVPMRDADGTPKGIRYRDVRSGRKWSQTGGGDGLFLATDLQAQDGELWVAEGMTDTIALLALGFPAVGRSSCNCGVAMLADLCARLRVRAVTIIADADGNRNAAGNVVQPGLDGAKSLGKRLGVKFRLVFPPRKTKDVRGYLLANADYGTAVVASRLRAWAADAKWDVPPPRRCA